MTKTSPTIVFFGSGPVAARSLELLAQDFQIEAIVTKPKPDHHRGDFPVVTVAEELGLKTLYARDKAELSQLFATKPVTSTIAVLIDFGIIVSRQVIDYFPLGIINSHFSLLPEWRGADPISFSILSGQAKTGVSVMVIDEGMDTGKLITQKGLPIAPDDTTPSLTDKLITLSHELLRDHLPDYIAGVIKPRQQPHPDRATYSRKLTKDDGLIDWTKPAAQIEREIRAFIDWPKSRTTLGGKEVIITSAQVTEQSGEPGNPIIIDKNLVIPCGNQALRIISLKPAGKNEMSGEAFIAGHKHLL